METERITLNQRERDRLRVLHEIKGKHISQIEAAQRLKISDRHIRRLPLPVLGPGCAARCSDVVIDVQAASVRIACTVPSVSSEKFKAV
jgi:hypothetical protein